MPGFIAKKLCPDLVIVPGNHDKYSAVSSQIMDVISKVCQSFLESSWLMLKSFSFDVINSPMSKIRRRRFSDYVRTCC